MVRKTCQPNHLIVESDQAGSCKPCQPRTCASPHLPIQLAGTKGVALHEPLAFSERDAPEIAELDLYSFGADPRPQRAQPNKGYALLLRRAGVILGRFDSLVPASAMEMVKISVRDTALPCQSDD